MEKLYSALNDVVSCIKDSNEYKKCLSLKEKMSGNSEIIELISKVKELQKKYVRSGYDEVVLEELDLVRTKLEEIPIYDMYLSNLEKVNEKIEYVKESLNDYFNNVFNE